MVSTLCGQSLTPRVVAVSNINQRRGVIPMRSVIGARSTTPMSFARVVTRVRAGPLTNEFMLRVIPHVAASHLSRGRRGLPAFAAIST
jgi:hypothetical protein